MCSGAKPIRTRRATAPDVPTAKESGYDVVVETWLGVFLPAKMPADIVGALSAAMNAASRSAAMKENLAKFALSYEPLRDFTPVAGRPPRRC